MSSGCVWHAPQDSMVKNKHLKVGAFTLTRDVQKFPLSDFNRVFIGCQLSNKSLFKCCMMKIADDFNTPLQCTVSLQTSFNSACVLASAGCDDTNSDITEIFTRPFHTKEVCFVGRAAASRGSEENLQTDVFSLPQPLRQAERQRRKQSMSVCVCVCQYDMGKKNQPKTY